MKSTFATDTSAREEEADFYFKQCLVGTILLSWSRKLARQEASLAARADDHAALPLTRQVTEWRKMQNESRSRWA
jgi:hypothetical protein